jgi:hypothetical protein
VQSKNPVGEDQLVFLQDCEKGVVIVYLTGKLCLREEIVKKADGSPVDGTYVRYIEDPRVILNPGDSEKNIVSTDPYGQRQLLLKVDGPSLMANHTSFDYAANSVLEDLKVSRSDCLPQYVLRSSRCVKKGEVV